MKYTSRLLAGVSLAAMAISLAACGGSDDQVPADNNTEIVNENVTVVDNDVDNIPSMDRPAPHDAHAVQP